MYLVTRTSDRIFRERCTARWPEFWSAPPCAPGPSLTAGSPVVFFYVLYARVSRSDHTDAKLDTFSHGRGGFVSSVHHR